MNVPIGKDVLPQMLADALAIHQAGRLEQAEQRYRDVLAIAPGHPDAMHLLGVLMHQRGHSDVAAEQIMAAIRANPAEAHYQVNLAVVLQRLQRHEEAVSACQAALRLEPGLVLAQVNLGIALQRLGRAEEAVVAFQAAIVADPNDAAAYVNLAGALRQLGRLDEAVAAFTAALERKPDHAEAHCDLGDTLKDLGRLEEAMKAYREALRSNPGLLQAQINLGIALKEAGQIGEALDCSLQLLNQQETAEAKLLFTECLAQADVETLPDVAGKLVERALREGWNRPSLLAPAIGRLLRKNPVFGQLVEQAVRSPSWSEQDTADALAELAGASLLPVFLQFCLNCDPALERLLTLCRSGLLLGAQPPAGSCPPASLLTFSCALAHQCFINEYVFACGDIEAAAVGQLQERMESALAEGGEIEPHELALLGCYMPLHSLAYSGSLLNSTWPEALRAVVTVQVAEPMQERKLRDAIPRLSQIRNEVSGSVRDQYEENPYPRWVIADPALSFPTMGQYIRGALGKSQIAIRDKPNPDVLVAGCGTGQHPIQVARMLPAASILAVDLSLSSLAYALRKTQELGLRNLQFAQADILELAQLGRTFDLIESVGVLHHLAEPKKGLDVLVSLLRPAGFMKLGLYSHMARIDFVTARAYIAEHAYGSSAADIRRCRQDLLAGAAGPLPAAIAASTDFASISGCRDLLFHVQEHRLTLPEITEWLDDLRLTFLGFAGPMNAIQHFRRQFVQAGSDTDLDLWHRYEMQNPETFVGMYQFWVRKQG